MRSHIVTLSAVVVAWFSLTVRVGICQPPSGEPQELLNRSNLGNWTYFLGDSTAQMEDVWSVKDGVLTCVGKPAGYLITEKKDFHDYALHLEWRWHEGRGGNSGVLLHCSTPRELGVWCKSVEVQLGHENAGDFWVIGTQLKVPDEDQRKKGRRFLNVNDDAENPLGEWNSMDIVCQGNEIRVTVNGRQVNEATNVSVTTGAIALQSEGTPIQFRNIRVQSLE